MLTPVYNEGKKSPMNKVEIKEIIKRNCLRRKKSGISIIKWGLIRIEIASIIPDKYGRLFSWSVKAKRQSSNRSIFILPRCNSK
jgi:hypothetical protein